MFPGLFFYTYLADQKTGGQGLLSLAFFIALQHQLITGMNLKKKLAADERR